MNQTNEGRSRRTGWYCMDCNSYLGPLTDEPALCACGNHHVIERIYADRAQQQETQKALDEIFGPTSNSSPPAR